MERAHVQVGHTKPSIVEHLDLKTNWIMGEIFRNIFEGDDCAVPELLPGDPAARGGI